MAYGMHAHVNTVIFRMWFFDVLFCEKCTHYKLRACLHAYVCKLTIRLTASGKLWNWYGGKSHCKKERSRIPECFVHYICYFWNREMVKCEKQNRTGEKRVIHWNERTGRENTCSKIKWNDMAKSHQAIIITIIIYC